MVDVFPTAFLFFAGALVVAFLPVALRRLVLVALPILVGLHIWYLPDGNHWQISFMGFDLELMRVDPMARIFGLVFSLAAFLGNLYAWYVRDTVQQVAALFYAGSAIGGVFAGDLVTLFFYWEGTALASVFLIWARGTEGAYHTGMRYLVVQIGSGVILIAGVALFYQDTGSIAFENMTLGSLATWLIFLSFGVKAAFPLLNNWLQDAYPAATVTGTVILSAFTTKLAIYALARGFAGTEILIYIGAVMALLPTLYAVIENDLRRVLAYSLNSQLGFMVVGIGVGTELALNGTVAHAFASTLYQALLFMAIGAVLFRTGTAKASDLGGLYRTMPLTMICCIIGGASISAFPLFSGFVTKSLILSAAAKAHYEYIWAILLFASAGAFFHSGIKTPYFAFFGRDSGLRPKEAPNSMLLAMGISSFLCIAVGVYPDPLYALLPFDVGYNSYTTTHVVTQLQLLIFVALAFTVLMRTGYYSQNLKSINLDTDWSYRKFAPAVIGYFAWAISAIWAGLTDFTLNRLNDFVIGLYKSYGPEGRIARVWPTGSMVIWIAVLLGAVLIVNYIP